MATMNPFDILGSDENDDPSQLVAAMSLEKPKKAPAPPAAAAAAQRGKPTAKLPSKPLPPTQAGECWISSFGHSVFQCFFVVS